MKAQRLKILLGVVFILFHFGIIGLIVAFTANDKFTQDEMFVSFGFVAPLFAATTTLILKGLLDDTGSITDTRVLSRTTAVLSILLTTIFLTAVIAAVLWKAFGSLGFENFVKLVGATETMLGGYLGTVFSNLFSHRNIPSQSNGSPV